jgi:hypothetical protein
VGKLTREMAKGAGRPPNNSGRDSQNFPEPTKAEALKAAGISIRQANRWEHLAAVPDADFEAALADPKEKPSTAGIIRKASAAFPPVLTAAISATY